MDKLNWDQLLDHAITEYRTSLYKAPSPNPENTKYDVKKRSYTHVHYQYHPETSIINDIYDGINPGNENIIVRCGIKKESIYLKKFLQKKYRTQFLQKFFNTDLFYTVNTFKPSGEICGDAKKSNLYRVSAFALDIDYKKSSTINRDMNPRDFYFYMIGEMLNFPSPTYIEYGHQLRLIYVLNDPINCKYGKKMIKVIERIQSFLCKRLNEEIKCNAAPQSLSSYFRVPGSINGKDGSIIHAETMSGNKYDIKKMLEEYLPIYDVQKKEKMKRRPKNNTFINTNNMLNTRLQDFKKLTSMENIPRETLCFLYINTWLQIHTNNMMDELRAFNSLFENPLPDNELRSKFSHQPLWKYKVKNSTILEMLGIDEKDALNMGLSFALSKRDREKKEKIVHGETRRQKCSQIRECILSLSKSGFNVDEIATKLNISKRTVYRYFKIEKEHTMSQKQFFAYRKDIIQQIKGIIKDAKELIPWYKNKSHKKENKRNLHSCEESIKRRELFWQIPHEDWNIDIILQE